MLLLGILLAASPQNSKAAIICGSSTGKPRRIDDTGNTGMDVTSTFETDNLDRQTRTLFIFDKTLFLLATNYFPCACWSNVTEINLKR